MSLLLIGCGPQKTSDKDVQTLTIKEYDELRGGKRNVVVLIDARPKGDYESGYIPGAINIPLPDMIANDPRLAEATHLVSYGGSWISDIGRVGAKKLIVLKYQNVYELRGGTDAWEAEGRKLVK